MCEFINSEEIKREINSFVVLIYERLVRLIVMYC